MHTYSLAVKEKKKLFPKGERRKVRQWVLQRYFLSLSLTVLLYERVMEPTLSTPHPLQSTLL